MPDAALLPRSPLDALAAASRPCRAAELRPVAVATRLVFRARDEAAIARAGEAFGVAIPRAACSSSGGDGRTALWLGPDEWMLCAAEEEPAAVASRVGAALEGLAHSLVDVTHRSVTLSVRGPDAASVLNAGCPLDLAVESFPVGTNTRTVLGKTEIVLTRVAADEFHVDVWRSFAAYTWAYLDEARREFL